MAGTPWLAPHGLHPTGAKGCTPWVGPRVAPPWPRRSDLATELQALVSEAKRGIDVDRCAVALGPEVKDETGGAQLPFAWRANALASVIVPLHVAAQTFPPSLNQLKTKPYLYYSGFLFRPFLASTN